MYKDFGFLQEDQRGITMKPKHDYIYIFSGRKDDLWQLVSVLILNPLVASIFIYYMTGVVIDIILTYLCVDFVVLVFWHRHARRNREDEMISRESEKKIIQQKLEALDQSQQNL